MLWFIGSPSPSLFAGVGVGIAAAVGSRHSRPLPSWARQLSLAAVGVGAGALVDRDVLVELSQRPISVVGGVLGTIVITLIAGQILRLSRHVDTPTAVLASIAGGASGVSAVAAEMRADEGIVLTVQYLRVLIVVLTVPLVAPLLGGVAEGSAQPGVVSSGWSWVFTAAAVLSGLVLARWITFTAAALLLPMGVAVGLSLGEVIPDSTVPSPVMVWAYALIGLAVGLSLTRPALRRLASLMPLALIQLAVGIVGCGVIGILFARSAGVSDLDGYLATTPGGVPVVVAVALESGANVGLVLSMQILRLVLALAMAPLVAWMLRRREPPPEVVAAK